MLWRTVLIVFFRSSSVFGVCLCLLCQLKKKSGKSVFCCIFTKPTHKKRDSKRKDHCLSNYNIFACRCGEDEWCTYPTFLVPISVYTRFTPLAFTIPGLTCASLKCGFFWCTLPCCVTTTHNTALLHQVASCTLCPNA